jgi:hypothetical protein
MVLGVWSTLERGRRWCSGLRGGEIFLAFDDMHLFLDLWLHLVWSISSLWCTYIYTLTLHSPHSWFTFWRFAFVFGFLLFALRNRVLLHWSQTGLVPWEFGLWISCHRLWDGHGSFIIRRSLGFIFWIWFPYLPCLIFWIFILLLCNIGDGKPAPKIRNSYQTTPKPHYFCPFDQTSRILTMSTE